MLKQNRMRHVSCDAKVTRALACLHKVILRIYILGYSVTRRSHIDVLVKM